MNILKRMASCLAVPVVLSANAATVCAAQPIKQITLLDERLSTESITSLKDGTLIVGSQGKGSVSRIAYGSTIAEEWIKPGTRGIHAVFGVLADEKFKTLWVCSDKTDAGEGSAELKTFDLKTGAPKASYPLPGEGVF